MRILTALLVASLVAGCTAAEEPSPALPATGEPPGAPPGPSPRTEVFTGTLSSAPGVPGKAEHRFEVPEGAVGINATLTWNESGDPPPKVRARFFDPAGDLVTETVKEAPGRARVATVPPPRAGPWILEVLVERATNLTYRLEASLEVQVPADNRLVDTLLLAPGTMREINLILEAGANISFRIESESPVKWDIHSHPARAGQPMGNDTSVLATYEAPERDIYSLALENPKGHPPSTVTYGVRGPFRLHSHTS